MDKRVLRDAAGTVRVVLDVLDGKPVPVPRIDPARVRAGVLRGLRGLLEHGLRRLDEEEARIENDGGPTAQ